MRFWDSSAIIPLLIYEPATHELARLVEHDEAMAVWWSTRVECWSAIARGASNARISPKEAERALPRLHPFQSTWNEIEPAEEVRRQAARLLRVHPLRAADALQLGAAILWAGRYDGREFVSLDARLREAARLEGFTVLPLTP